MLSSVVLRSLRRSRLHNVFNKTLCMPALTQILQTVGYHDKCVVNESTFINVPPQAKSTLTSSTATTAKVIDVSMHEVYKQDKHFLKVVWNDGTISRYPYIFLRENCKCPECYQPSSKQRKVCLLKEDGYADTTIREAELSKNGSSLQCLWPNAHQSVYTAAWLYERRMPEAEDKLTTSPVINKIVNDDLVCWDNSQMQGNIPRFEYNAVMNDEKSLFDCLYTFYQHGLLLLDNSPVREGVVDELTARIGYPKLTHYGGVFDVKTKGAPSNLAYTTEYLPFHIDLPFLTKSPEIQMLHCIEQAADNAGGDSLFVDAFTAATKLMEDNYAAFETLCNIEIAFQDLGTDMYGEFNISLSRPTIELNKHNRLQKIMLNCTVRQDKFNNLTPEEILKFYDAYHQYLSILYQPEYTVQHRLKPGEIVLFYNLRVLHSRTQITDTTSGRWLQGIYLDWDVIFSKLRVLHEKLALESPHVHTDTNAFF